MKTLESRSLIKVIHSKFNSTVCLCIHDKAGKDERLFNVAAFAKDSEALHWANDLSEFIGNVPVVYIDVAN